MKHANSALIGAMSIISVMSLTWPFFFEAISSGSTAHVTDSPVLIMVFVPALLALGIMNVAAGHLDSKSVAMLGVLSGIGIMMRIATGGIGGTELIFFLIVVAPAVFGSHFGFLLGAMSILASAVFTGGIGPWMPFQMIGAAWIGYFSGYLSRIPRANSRLTLCMYAMVASIAFGVVMNMWFWPFAIEGDTALSFQPGAPLRTNLRRYVAFHGATSLGWDIMRGISTCTLIIFAGKPVLASLERINRRARFDAVAVFEPSNPHHSPAEASRS